MARGYFAQRPQRLRSHATTTRRKRTTKSVAIESLMNQDRKLLKGLMKEALEDILEAR